MGRRLLAVTLLAFGLLAPATAEAKTVRTFWQQRAYVADRFFSQIGFIPINGIQTPGKATRYKAGSTTYVVTWNNALMNRSTTAALKAAARYVRYSPVSDGVFSDRFLTKKERRSWDVMVDLARDADVLVVNRENPVCQTGLTLAQAKGIARGTITRWSEVAALPAGQPDAIVRRLIGRPGGKGDAFAEPRFGVKGRSPHTVIKADGGVSETVTDRAVAAVTSWSRVRAGSGGCVVALGGVPVTDASVHGLTLPGAYPIQYVMHRKRPKAGEGRVLWREYVRFLKSDRAADLLRPTGVLLKAETPPAA